MFIIYKFINITLLYYNCFNYSSFSHWWVLQQKKMLCLWKKTLLNLRCTAYTKFKISSNLNNEKEWLRIWSTFTKTNLGDYKLACCLRLCEIDLKLFSDTKMSH